MSAWGNMFNKRWADNTYRHYNGYSEVQTLLEVEVAKLGVPYRAQYPFPGFHIIADFGVPSLKLLIECDGKEHKQKKKREEDIERDKKLLDAGWFTVRVQNEDVLRDPAKAMETILARLQEMKEEYDG